MARTMTEFCPLVNMKHVSLCFICFHHIEINNLSMVTIHCHGLISSPGRACRSLGLLSDSGEGAGMGTAAGLLFIPCNDCRA